MVVQVEQARECVYDSSSTSAKLKTITTLIYSIQTGDSLPPLCVWVCVSYFGTGGGCEISQIWSPALKPALTVLFTIKLIGSALVLHVTHIVICTRPMHIML